MLLRAHRGRGRRLAHGRPQLVQQGVQVALGSQVPPAAGGAAGAERAAGRAAAQAGGGAPAPGAGLWAQQGVQFVRCQAGGGAPGPAHAGRGGAPPQRRRRGGGGRGEAAAWRRPPRRQQRRTVYGPLRACARGDAGRCTAAVPLGRPVEGDVENGLEQVVLPVVNHRSAAVRLGLVGPEQQPRRRRRAPARGGVECIQGGGEDRQSDSTNAIFQQAPPKPSQGLSVAGARE